MNKHSRQSIHPSYRRANLKFLLAGTIGLVVVGVGGWLLVQTSGIGKANQLLQRMPEIDKSLLSARAKKLMLSCEESVRINPQDPSAWGLLGRACLAHQFQVESRECFAIAAELDPENFEWYYGQALSYIPTENEKAMDLIRQAIGHCDQNLDQLQCRLAELLFEESEFSECRELVDAVLKKRPDHPRAQMLLARLLLLENKPQESLLAAEKVIAFQPNRRETLRLLSQIHLRLGNTPEANRYAAQSEDPDSYNESWPDEVNQKIQSLRKDINKLVDDALRMPPTMIKQRIQVLEEAVAEEPQEPQWHVFLGQTLLKVKDYRRAAQVMRNAIAVHPNSAIVHYTYGLVLLNEGKAEEAIPILEKAVKLKPDYSSAFRDLGIAYRQQKKWDPAIQAFRKSIEILPGNFKTQLNLAVTLEMAGQTELAISAYEECLKLDQESADVCLLLGKLYSNQKGQQDQARRYLQMAIDLDPQLAEAKALLNSLKSN